MQKMTCLAACLTGIVCSIMAYALDHWI